VALLKYLETIAINQNYIQEEIKTGYIQGILATILFRVFCVPISSLKT
jgi:hypothetical protein